MVKMSEAFPSEFLKATDIDGKGDVPVTIARIEIKNFGEGERKPVLYFVGTKKSLSLNLTNRGSLVHLFGDETDNWHNQSIVLFVTDTMYMGKPERGIRIKPQAMMVETAPQTVTAPNASQNTDAFAGPDIDDEIPF